MQSIGLLLTALLFSFAIHAQTAEDSVKAVVNKLFTGMKEADSTIIKTSFSETAILQTISNKGGTISVRSDEVKAFARSISQLAKGDADEQIQFEVVKVDAALASVWTPYKFYYKGKFSHCGVNSFQLVRLNGEWKIQYLIDTRRQQPCL